MSQVSTQPVRLALTRHLVPNPSAPNRETFIAALLAQLQNDSGRERSIIVNVGEAGTERLVLFCSANLTAPIVAAGTVAVDVAAVSAYRPFVRSIVAGARGAVLTIREALRSVPVVSVSTACLQLCQQLDVIALMAEGYALQSGDDAQQARAQALLSASQALRESATRTDDNVRCMDDLHYEVSPALHAVDETFA